MDEDDCMVDIAKFFLEFTVEESCGKCTACRIGTKRMVEILTKITKGQAVMEDLDKLEELCHYVKANSLCGLGQTAPNPVLSTLHFFRDEYEAHIKENAVRQAYVRRFSPSTSTATSAADVRCVPATVLPEQSWALSRIRMSLTRTSVSSAALVWKKCKFGAIYKK